MKRKKNRKSEILYAAGQLFSKKGYAAASIRDLAEMVGLEPSSLYNHIDSKEQILHDICMTCADHYAEGMHQITNNKGDYQSKILSLLDLHISEATQHPSSIIVFNDEWRHLKEEDLKLFLSKRKKYEEAFKKILKQGMQENEFIIMPPKIAFQIVLNSVKWIHYSSSKYSQQQVQDISKEIKKFISRGLFCVK